MRFRSTFLVLATILLAAGAFAQGVQTATVTGTVTSPDGSALPGVTVTAASRAQLGDRTTVTGANGEYILRGLTPGEYTITFELEGMQTHESKVVLSLGSNTHIDAAMKMTAASETIVVVGAAPSALETSTVSANISKEQVDQLPLVRTPTGIASLAGAVTSRTPVAGQLSINGGMAYDNSFLVNGINVQDPIFGSTNNLFIEDAILETQVLTSGISAEYGAFTGGVLNVITKSGGNEFSGSLRGDFTKPEWRDETPYEQGFRGDGVPRATATKRTGGVGEVYTATLGGPFVRDRLWFFAAVRDEENTAPRQLGVTGINLPFLEENRRIEGKLTGNITPKHNLQVSYIENPVTRNYEIQVAPLTPDAVGVNSERVNDGTVVNYNGVLTSSLFAEARWSEKNFGFRGLGGTSTNIVDSPIRALGRHGTPGAGTFNAPYFDATDPEDRNNESYYGALSYFLGTSSWGSHDIKGGVERFTVTRTGGNSQTSTDYVFYTGYKSVGGVPVLSGDQRFTPVFTPFTGANNNWSAVGWWISTRGSVADVTTDSLFINDRWDLNSRWSFNLGLRHEIVDSEATGQITSVDTTTTTPRFGVSFDPLANGKYKFDVTYAHYAGRYNPAITAENTPVGNPSLLYGYYVGPAGEGRDFAPGFDPANYVFFFANVPTGNVFMEDGLHAPIQKELTISGGMALPKGGYAKLTLIDRNLTGMIDDFITIDQGCTDIVFQGINAGCFDNVVYRNTSGPEREYQAVELQGRYPIFRNWAVEGNYTYQIKNDGNYEGEGGQAIGATVFGDYPELRVARNNPVGHLSQFQEHKVRLWTTYTLDFGRLGHLNTGVIYRYDSAQTFSYSAGGVALSAAQRGRDPGYSSPPTSQTLFFGERGTGEYNDSSEFDLSLVYGMTVFNRVEPWIKFDVTNLFNADTLLTYNTTVSVDNTSTLDGDGLRTGFTKGTSFGRPTGAGSYTVPREYKISAGVRF